MRKLVLLVVLIIVTIACEEKIVEDSAYVIGIKEHRAEKDSSMQHSPTSPFNKKGEISFSPLVYFDIDSTYIYKSKLTRHENPEPVTIYGTQGEARNASRFGYLNIETDSTYKLNVYQIQISDSSYYYSIWFTDNTTGKETYGVGRYIDFQFEEDPEYIYTIDFNLTYSPWCAYNPKYSCAVPTKKDYLPLRILAGEKSYHK